MDVKNDDTGRSAPPLPASSSEFTTALTHYYRGEILRMSGWRDRIDRTTNWAITAVAAMLSLSLSAPAAHHGVLLFAMLVVMLLLWIEARRYRFFDVYRARVRQIEHNYLAEVFCPTSEPRKDWASVLGEDLRTPRFLITRRTAVSRRLRRNYGLMFLILLLAWVLKISSPELQTEGAEVETFWSVHRLLDNAILGPLPGWLVLSAVAAFYGWLAFMVLRRDESTDELTYGDVHV